jgi:hypothetical protein
LDLLDPPTSRRRIKVVRSTFDSTRSYPCAETLVNEDAAGAEIYFVAVSTRIALGVGAASVVLLAGCGGGGTPVQSSPGSQQLKPNNYTHNGDPDAEPGTVPGAMTVLTTDGKGHFELRVQNQSSFGKINDFTWVPPSALTITGVITSSRGSCALAGTRLECQVNLPPPSCTCKPGPVVVIRFTGTTVRTAPGHSVGYADGSLRIGNVTPVPYVIPSAPNKLSSTTPGD